MNNKTPQQDFVIYCDMDGVLCDFPRHATDLMNKSLYDENVPQITRLKGLKALETDGLSKFEYSTDGNVPRPYRSYMYDLISNNTNFWATMPFAPGGAELWRNLRDIKKGSPNITVELLTTPTDEASKRGKLEWITKNLGQIITNFSKTKWEYAMPTTLLIDDRSKNINAFKKAGGFVIPYDMNKPSEPEETIIKLCIICGFVPRFR